MERRKFILIATAGGIAIALPTWYFKIRSISYDKSLADTPLLSLIWDKTTINAIGNQYLLLVPEEKKERSLVKILSTDTKDNATHSAIANQKIKHDFEEGNTIIIDGWILSKTEARQCALLSTIALKK
tara:strand:+ start:3955 stop:4338 length:384 start_codon:yes stop_codon:yes gene_type:complete